MPAKWALLATLAAAPAAHAAQRIVPLIPSTAQVSFTTYAMSLFPLPGHFARFAGSLTIDAAHPDACTVTLHIEASSLSMANPARVRDALSPKLLDAARFPQIIYIGGCAGDRAAGSLTMHGVTHDITLQTAREGSQVTATGSLRRQDYGVDGLPGLVGRTIRIGFALTLPPDLATVP